MTAPRTFRNTPPRRPIENYDENQMQRERIAQLEALVEQLSAEPLLHGSVIAVDKVREVVTVVRSKGEILDVALPQQDVRIGDIVRLSGQTMQIIDVIPPTAVGETALVRSAVNETSSRVDVSGGVRVVIHSPNIKEVEAGDQVVLDSSGLVVLANLGKDDSVYKLQTLVNVGWDDIGGLASQKRDLREAVESPYYTKGEFAIYGDDACKGILLMGPPGNGKTLLGKAAATAQARLLNSSSAGSRGFFYVKGPEILEKWVGNAEANIRGLFARGRKHAQKSGYPALVFIDEAESILGLRGSGISSDMEKTIVPTFLSEMSGFDDDSVFVILATNRAESLDPAVVRDGRMDLKIMVPRPDQTAALEIALIHLRRAPLVSGFSVTEAADVLVRELFAPDKRYYELQLNGTKHDFTLAGLVSGAMIESAVKRAKTHAKRRDIAARKACGVTESDFVAAAADIFVQNQGLNHNEAIDDFVSLRGGQSGGKVTGFRRVQAMM